MRGKPNPFGQARPRMANAGEQGRTLIAKRNAGQKGKRKKLAKERMSRAN